MNLEETAAKWESAEFVFIPWKNRDNVFVLKAYGIVQEELEEAQMTLQSLLTLRNVGPFREDCQSLLNDLFETSETLDLLIKVQNMWASLESVFTGGDIAKQLPMEAKRFVRINKDYQKNMERAYNTKLVVPVCRNNTLQASLPAMFPELEKCQKSLDSYLEQKRSKFPRFYFVSNASLLQILSQGSDPESMNAHYAKVFDSIDHVEHRPSNKNIIETMVGKGYIGVPFSNPVECTRNIEDWLNEILRQMRVTMKDHCRQCAEAVLAEGSQIHKSETSLRTFVDDSLAQFALLGLQFLWTKETESALRAVGSNGSSRAAAKIMKECGSLMTRILGWLSGWCLHDLGPKFNRKKIETLITVHLHQRDVTDEMRQLAKEGKIRGGAGDFEWLKQGRFYFDPHGRDDLNADGCCRISVTDVDFTYQSEFLAVRERLVITPLTDRCYITLSQALGNHFGGAPAGPAGTGKTETVKDFGATLGIWVVRSPHPFAFHLPPPPPPPAPPASAPPPPASAPPSSSDVATKL
eukprot:scaffold57_cov254-Pinguiococcus_pyrenoidosus.AAC.41